jgi:hypothetical protein
LGVFDVSFTDTLSKCATPRFRPADAAVNHCAHRSRIMVVETVTIAAGATVGGFADA